MNFPGYLLYSRYVSAHVLWVCDFRTKNVVTPLRDNMAYLLQKWAISIFNFDIHMIKSNKIP